MARGVETGNHPNRQVGPHLSPHWRTTTSITGPMGAVSAHIPDPDDSGITMAAWSGPQGHHAEVEQSRSSSYGYMRGMEHDRYVAGPFRTGMRAQIAAESLSRRVENEGNVSPYQQESWSEYRGRHI